MLLWIRVWLVTLLLDLTSSVIGSHIEQRHIYDLLYNLVDNDNSPAMKAIPGANGHSTAYLLRGLPVHRDIRVASQVVKKLIAEIATGKEFTILATLRQQERNTGSIISFTSKSHERLLEVESSGRRDEIRFHYVHNNKSRTEIFPYELADNQWHKVALSISKHFLQLFIDCKKVYERPLKETIDFHSFPTEESLELWLGQRGHKQVFFKGAVENVKLVIFPQGFKEQCPHASVACPTCNEFHDLEESVSKLYSVIDQLSQKLLSAESRISELETCECMRSCDVEGTRYRDGESWQPDYCTKCTCREGSVVCEEPQCPPVTCQNPVFLDGQCCPTCLRHCVFSGVRYDHGEGFSPRSCVNCKCQDGRMTCHPQDTSECPRLDCPRHEQISVNGECCKYCIGADYCSVGHDCHSNATCVNLATKYACQCNLGYVGDGKHCEDRDECVEIGGLHGHHCHKNTRCVNTAGSYQCQCLPGYRRVDPYRCEEVDECLLGEHDCDEHADCVNTEGGYRCECQLGYQGTGQACQPVCRELCENGGECVSPGTCQCRKGFVGKTCQKDLDECEMGISQCHARSVCVNIPGSYRCDCRLGFYSNQLDNQQGELCLDLNECAGWGPGHHCPVGTVCENTEGSYTCACLEEGGCKGGCHFGEKLYNNGTVWKPDQNHCSLCECKNGEVHCRHETCDCHVTNVDLSCCPQCDPRNRCHHQELPIVYYSGDTWNYQCETCQCLNGEVDCWQLECPSLSCPHLIQEEGDCCPRCADPDPCETSEPGNHGHEQCPFRDKNYRPGETWVDSIDRCLTCTCKHGKMCCSYDQECSLEEDEERHHSGRPKHRDKTGPPGLRDKGEAGREEGARVDPYKGRQPER